MARELKTTVELAGVLSPTLQKSIQDAVAKLEQLSEETLQSAGAAAKLDAEIKTQEDVLKALRSGYADFVVAGEESSDKAQKLATEIAALSNDLSSNKNRLSAAEDAADALGDAMTEASNDAAESSDGYTVLGNTVANLASEVIQNAIDKFKELMTESDTALAFLEARTGATGASLEGFETVLNDVYAGGYGDSITDVSDSLAQVVQMTDGLDDASLAQVTQNAMTLNDVFGYDVRESLRATNSLMDQFGITSEEAYNLIAQGAQNGLDQNGDLLDTINEYAVQFQSAGYSADDMLNMLANGAESGTWSIDKLGDAVKEFNIRMSDGTANDYLQQIGLNADDIIARFNSGGEDAQSAIGDVMAALQECDNETLQYQAGVGLFGTMWEDLGIDAVASLMDTEGAITSTNDAMAKMDEAAHDTLPDSMTRLGRTIETEVFTPIAEKLTPVIQDAVDFVTDKVGPAVDWIADHLPQIGIAVGAVSAALVAANWGTIVNKVGSISKIFSGFGGVLTKIPGPALAIIGIIAALAAGFAYLWQNNDDFRAQMMDTWEQLKGTFSQLGDTLGQTLQQLMPVLSELANTVLSSLGEMAAAIVPFLADVLVSLLPVIVNLLQQLMPIISVIVGDVLTMLIDVLQSLMPVIGQLISDVLTVLVDILQGLMPVLMDIINAILPVVLQLIQTILPVISQIVQAVLPILVQLINAIAPVLTQLVQAILPVVLGLLDALMPILQMALSLLQPLLDLVVAILQPIINIISSAITPLINVLTALIQSVLQPILPILEVVGQYFVDVLGGAIQSVKPIVDALIGVFQGLINFIQGVFAGNWRAAWDGVVQVFGGLWDGLVAIVKAPINGVIGLINRAIRALNNISVTIPEWVPVVGGNTYGIDLPTIPQLARGGFTNGVSIAGEAGTEAVISFDPAYRAENIRLWSQAGAMLGAYDQPKTGVTATAARLLSLDDFSLGSLAAGGIVIYNDFSGFTWSPQIQTAGGDQSTDLMAELRAHEAEFFDWLEDFARAREEAVYV